MNLHHFHQTDSLGHPCCFRTHLEFGGIDLDELGVDRITLCSHNDPALAEPGHFAMGQFTSATADGHAGLYGESPEQELRFFTDINHEDAGACDVTFVRAGDQNQWHRIAFILKDRQSPGVRINIQIDPRWMYAHRG